ncbi:MAG: MarR family transcriptional regulator [Lachnospiraceae bacterium]|nr:MarR family transcriptional regulator [Lachnospiraceae bacterium]
MEHRLTERFIEAGKLHRSVLERLLNKTGVHRSQHQLLMCLSWNPDISQKKLAALYHVSTAAIAVSLKKLEKGGYIKRAVDTEDNRYNRIRLTAKGHSVVESSHTLFFEVEERMFAGFAGEEKERFLSYLQRLSDNLGRISGIKTTEGETKTE